MKILPRNFLTKYFIIAVLALGAIPAFSQVSISINIAPPPLQVYEQPDCPDDGYIWTPGYWAYGDNNYYWVPGAWVQPPEIGVFWTPPYWESDGDTYVFYPGYWGPEVGYYGGINYGYGYGGRGYGGGRWEGGHFSYNTAVNNIRSAHVHNTYADRTAINNNTNKVSFNGGKGGVQAQPTAHERQFSTERHTQSTSVQKPEAAIHSQAPTQQKTEPQQEPAQVQQPEHQQRQFAPQQQEIQPKQESHLQPQAQTQPPAHEQQAQPKQESHPQKQTQQSAPDKKPAEQPDKKSNHDANNPPGH
jgi:hypothetical protein